MERIYEQKLRRRQAAYHKAVVKRLIDCSNCLGTTAKLAKRNRARVSARDLLGRPKKPLILGLSMAQKYKF